MSININGNIPVQFCEEDRKALDALGRKLDIINDTLALIYQALPSGIPAVATEAQDAPKSEPKAEPTPEVETPTEAQNVEEETVEPVKPEPVETPELVGAPAEESAKVVALSDIQKKVVELSAAGKKAEVREIVTKYASRVSAIPAEHTAEVWSQLTALEG